MKDIETIIEDVIAELGLCHSPTTGHFTKCDKGSVYSLTKKAAKKHDVDASYVKRGSVTSKKRRSPPKVKAKYGLNTSKSKSGGRKTLAGDDINPKRSVSKYPKLYSEIDEDHLDSIGYPKELRALGSGTIHLEGDHEVVTMKIDALVKLVIDVMRHRDVQLVENNANDLKNKCKAIGYIDAATAQERVLKGINAAALASDGKLFNAK